MKIRKAIVEGNHLAHRKSNVFPRMQCKRRVLLKKMYKTSKRDERWTQRFITLSVQDYSDVDRYSEFTGFKKIADQK